MTVTIATMLIAMAMYLLWPGFREAVDKTKGPLPPDNKESAKSKDNQNRQDA